jgi:thioredoxin-like negative regulator of GroEL
MTYEEALAAGGRTIVLFYGAACAPCAALKPLLRAECAIQGLPLVELNVAGELAVARALQLRAVPSVVLLVDGVAKLLSTGAVPPADVINRLKGLRG